MTGFSSIHDFSGGTSLETTGTIGKTKTKYHFEFSNDQVCAFYAIQFLDWNSPKLRLTIPLKNKVKQMQGWARGLGKVCEGMGYLV